jgi:hypothetical protein
MLLEMTWTLSSWAAIPVAAVERARMVKSSEHDFRKVVAGFRKKSCSFKKLSDEPHSLE